MGGQTWGNATAGPEANRSAQVHGHCTTEPEDQAGCGSWGWLVQEEGRGEVACRADLRAAGGAWRCSAALAVTCRSPPSCLHLALQSVSFSLV